MKFLLDHNLSPRLARALNELSADHDVVALREKFPPDTKDHVWMEVLGREGEWAVVSGDRAIFKSAQTLAAWRESRLTIFFLAPAWSSLTHWPKAAKLVQFWPLIETHATSVVPGVCYVVNVRGKLEVLPPPG